MEDNLSPAPAAQVDLIDDEPAIDLMSDDENDKLAVHADESMQESQEADDDRMDVDEKPGR